MIQDLVNINRNITNISMTRGDTLAFGFEIEGLDSDQTITNAYFTVKHHKEDTVNTFQLSFDDQTIMDEGDGLYSVRAIPALTAGLEPDTYYYDLKIELDNDTYTIMSGKLIIKKGVKE